MRSAARGAFSFGAGSRPEQHGAVLARRGDVVVVTINYRLGLFGWLRGTDVCGDALPTTGNEGLHDQLAALNYVKHEIAAFGGDPDNVTVFGQSAGAVSINAMLAMSQARQLFHKAILQSGTSVFQQPAAANRVMHQILTEVGLAPGEAGRLREVPAADMLQAQTRATPRERGVVYRPVADGVDVPLKPLAAIAAGSAAGIPLLVGTNQEEQKFFGRLDQDVDRLTDKLLLERLAGWRTGSEDADNPDFDPVEALDVYRQSRAVRGQGTTTPELWVALMSDRRFRVPMMRLAELHAAHTPQTYTYLFTWQSPGWNGKLGSGHTVEVLPRRSTMLLGTTCGSVDAPYEPERSFWAAHAPLSTPEAATAV